MSRIGFDFGTTNSTISYYDREAGYLKCFHAAPDAPDYIPTVVAYSRRRNQDTERVEIGLSAKENGEDSPNVCSRFKLRLGSRFDELLPGKTKTAHEAAKDYIRTLFAQLSQAQGTPESMVMTVPAAWHREQMNLTACENIRTVLQEIEGMPAQIRFQSEPVAAAAYFCWRWKEDGHAPYAGKLLIVDYGGGTLDVTHCQISGAGVIQTLDSFGTGEEGDNIGEGHAGCAFLSRVTELLLARRGTEPDDAVSAAVRQKLEQLLINKTDFVTETMIDYLVAPDLCTEEEQTLFAIPVFGPRDTVPVLCSDLLQAFNEINAPVLRRALEQICDTADYDPAAIKIITVGGFSNFCCVAREVRSFFGSVLGQPDERFPDTLSNENRALAIAKGAALLASEIMSVEPTFPYEIGIIAAKPEPDDPERYSDTEIPLIQRHARTEEFRSPVFSSERITVYAEGRLFIRIYKKHSGNERQVFRLENTADLRQIIPADAQKHKLEIGLSVDDDGIPTLHTRDETGKLRSASLDKILETLDVVTE